MKQYATRLTGGPYLVIDFSASLRFYLDFGSDSYNII